MTGNELRKAYLDFFKDKGHLIMPSAPLIPENDPSILWINAGMAPFKPYFNGSKTPPETRIVSSQKCIRTNDIENVGKTDRHHTFFEMLGNFSFGDYFKKEAISWAWEFVTEILEMDRDKLWITIYHDDEEAFRIWHDHLGINEKKIIKMGKKDNFWEIGTGPCGPCSEIHYDRGEKYGSSKEDVVGGEGGRFLEIWNLVFTQYDKTEEGEYLPLPSKNIDTGMGLERVASILQGVDSNFETDLLKPMIDFLVEDTGITYRKSPEITTAFRVIADHARGITMSIHDGAVPGNEGRGYVIRRVLRRAVRYGKSLGYDSPFLYKIVPVVIETMKGGYPELNEKKEEISKLIKSEEMRFLETLNQGLDILNRMIEGLDDKKILSGEKAFKLYDTYGFPLDLTRDVLEEKDFKVDEEGFNIEMKKQRNRARNAREEVGFASPEEEKIYRSLRENHGENEFSGYKELKTKDSILLILREGKKVKRLKGGEKGEMVFKKTPFYAESGGQVGDTGIIKTESSKAVVNDTRKKAGMIVHQVEVEKGEFKSGQEITAAVTSGMRRATARNHSATHLLHQALKEVLGEHVNQKGSLVEPKRLRFDFSHFSALTPEEIERIEERVNLMILKNLKVNTLITNIDKARKLGATALFDDKYDVKVRVISMGDYSKELCGGTHVNFTSEIGLFKIINESSTAAGIRRIEAITGMGVYEFINKQDKLIKSSAEKLKVEPERLLSRIEELKIQLKNNEKEIASLKDRMATSKTDELLDKVEEVEGVPLLTAEFKDMDNESLRKLSDQLKEKLERGIIVLASNIDGKVLFVTAVSDDLVKEGYHAGKIIAEAAKITGGGGGGRPDMAQAGGRDTSKIQSALNEIKNLI